MAVLPDRLRQRVEDAGLFAVPPITDNPFFDQTIATEVFNFFRGTVRRTFRW